MSLFGCARSFVVARGIFDLHCCEWDLSWQAWKLLVVVRGIYFPDQGSNSGPLHWELAVLVTGPPGTFWWKTSKCPAVHSPGFLWASVALVLFFAHWCFLLILRAAWLCVPGCCGNIWEGRAVWPSHIVGCSKGGCWELPWWSSD